MIATLSDKLTLAYLKLLSRRAELDEKALLIALFVLAAVVGLTPLGRNSAVSGKEGQG